VADSKGGTVRGGRPLTQLAQIFFFIKPPFSVKRAYSSLCAFAINYDEADTLSSATPPPFQKFYGSATGVWGTLGNS